MTNLPLAEATVLELDLKTPGPLYQKVYFALREAILARRYAPGMKLPATRSFAKRLSISRNTVVYAYDRLMDEGYIETRHGSGSYVARTLPDTFLSVDPIPTRHSGSEARPEEVLSRRGRLIAAGRSSGDGQAPLAPGIPDYAAFPLEKWTRLLARQWRGATSAMLGYGDPAGLWRLRQAIAEYCRACRAVDCEAEQVLVVAGAQHGLDLTARLLLDPGDVVWIEEPGYPGARGALLANGARLCPVPLDDAGLNWQQGSRRHPAPKLVYITPSHSYPSGVTMSLTRRLELLAYSEEVGAWVLEDDYDSEYRFDSRPLAAIQGLSRDGRVIYIGTFSKVLFPSLRLGYLVVPRSLVPAFSDARSLMDGYTPTVIQAALADFIEQGHFAAHLRRMRALYQQRQQVLVDALSSHLSTWLEVVPTGAGMHLVAYARAPLDEEAISRAAAERGVQLRPLGRYFLDQPSRQGFVLGYAGFDETTLVASVKKLVPVFASLATCPSGQAASAPQRALSEHVPRQT